jgi:hypothetical protein
MGIFAFINHASNFLAPALWMALLIPLGGRFILKNRPAALSLKAVIALHFIVGCVVLAGGLVVFGQDGKMLTYLALVLAAASSQWLLLRR